MFILLVRLRTPGGLIGESQSVIDDDRNNKQRGLRTHDVSGMSCITLTLNDKLKPIRVLK